MIKQTLVAVFSFVFVLSVQAELALNSIFMEHMVLQREIPVKIYGSANAGETIKVAFASQVKTTTAGSDGKWSAELNPMEANASAQSLYVSSSKEKITIKDILIGDVWLCTGQSNMAGIVESYVNYGNGMFEEFKHVPGDYHNDQIRFFSIKPNATDQPQEDPIVQQAWTACTPESALQFSATGYFFGQELQPEIDIPLGLIKCAHGGTNVGSWLPREAMAKSAEATTAYLAPYEAALERYPQASAKYKVQLEQWETTGEGRRPFKPMGATHLKRPAGLYNSMLYPLHTFSVKGAIWYQGENEANNGLSKEYEDTFKLMIETWREHWGQGDFPFIFVQLAAYKKVEEQPSDSEWARLRESQLKTSQNVANTAMVVAIDGGLTQNIHPPYKPVIGERLANQALRIAYSDNGLSQGPSFTSMSLKKGKAILRFKHIGSGLIAKDTTMDGYGPNPYKLSSKKLEGFAVAGEDKVFHWADAAIKGDTVIIQSEKVPSPVAVRYAWANFPICNLYNKDGFPASPFRTDDW